MVVDDDTDHLLLCTLVFEKRGYNVKALQGCREEHELTDAVAMFHPDLILMDHNMPGICGSDLTKLLKANSSTNSIPIVYFTSELDIERLAKEAGADGHCKKPFKIVDLVEVVKHFAA